VSSYWVNFATSGDPNGKGLPVWEPYQTSTDRAMGFGNTPAMMALPHKPALDFLDRFNLRPLGAAAAR
jgi:para-nitrobenzyl esterase